MKSKDFFKQLDKEFDKMISPVSEKLKNEPIVIRSSETDKKVSYFPYKKLNRFLSAAAAFVLICTVVLGGIFAISSGESYTVMNVDINPSVSVVLGSNYKVVKAVSKNADGDALLNDEDFVESLKGNDAKDAAVLIAERAAKMGFIDLNNYGTAENYNQINISLSSAKKINDSFKDEISNEVTSYFCKQGVYIYTSVTADIQKETNKLAETYKEQNSLFFERFENAKDLTDYAESAVYEYAEVLLDDAFYKYDLFTKIEEINGLLKEDSDNLFKLGYWRIKDTELNENVSNLCLQMESTLKNMKDAYGLEFSDELSYYTEYNTYLTSILFADINELRTLSEEGINAQNFGGAQNTEVRLNYFYFVSNNIFQTLIDAILNGETTEVEDIVTDVASLVADKAQSLYNRYSLAFESTRTAIDKNEYNDFLNRIGK